jgi:hypothetical protein
MRSERARTRRRRARRELLRTARHEAGHVAACLFTDTPFRDVTIIADKTGKDGSHPNMGSVRGFRSPGKSLRKLEALAMVYLAGHLATSGGKGVSWRHLQSSMDDLGRASHCSRKMREKDRFPAYRIMLPPKSQEVALDAFGQTKAHLDYLEQRVMAHFEIGWWAVVDAIALALTRKKTLTYEECQTIASEVRTGRLLYPELIKRRDAVYRRYRL